jgi:hypothetical protein
MGELIDINPALTRRRRRRREFVSEQRVALRMIRFYIQITEREIQKSVMAICDQATSAPRVEEAIEALSILNVVLERHKKDAREIEWLING